MNRLTAMAILLVLSSYVNAWAEAKAPEYQPLTTDDTKAFSRQHVGHSLSAIKKEFPNLKRLTEQEWTSEIPLGPGAHERITRRRFVLRDDQVVGVFTEYLAVGCILVEPKHKDAAKP